MVTPKEIQERARQAAKRDPGITAEEFQGIRKRLEELNSELTAALGMCQVHGGAPTSKESVNKVMDLTRQLEKEAGKLEDVEPADFVHEEEETN